MDFITLEYLTSHIQEKDLKMILQTNTLDSSNSILSFCEDAAIARIRDALAQRYDVELVFDNPEPLVHYPQVARWVGCLMIYYLYERIPDALVPDRVTKNYDDVEFLLLEIADGKKSTTLPRLTDSSDGTPFTKFKWGSYSPRSH